MINLSDYDDFGPEEDARHAKFRPNHMPKTNRARILAAIAEVDEPARTHSEVLFSPSLNATSEEREWIISYLGQFHDGEQITDVLRRVKGDKEANVCCCAAHPSAGLELIAVKLYRPHKFRNLRNDAVYRQGRPVLDR